MLRRHNLLREAPRLAVQIYLLVFMDDGMLTEASLHEQVWFHQPPFRRVMGGM